VDFELDMSVFLGFGEGVEDLIIEKVILN